MGIIFLLALPVLMYFLLIRPQQRRVKEQQALLSAVEEGDEVVTSGGVYGFVNAVEGDIIWLDIADGVEIRIAKGAIVKRTPPEEQGAEGDGADATAEANPTASANGASPAVEPDPEEHQPGPEVER